MCASMPWLGGSDVLVLQRSSHSPLKTHLQQDVLPGPETLPALLAASVTCTVHCVCILNIQCRNLTANVLQFACQCSLFCMRFLACMGITWCWCVHDLVNNHCMDWGVALCNAVAG